MKMNCKFGGYIRIEKFDCVATILPMLFKDGNANKLINFYEDLVIFLEIKLILDENDQIQLIIFQKFVRVLRVRSILETKRILVLIKSKFNALIHARLDFY